MRKLNEASPDGPNGSDGTENLKDCDVASANNSWIFVLLCPVFRAQPKPLSLSLNKHHSYAHQPKKKNKEKMKWEARYHVQMPALRLMAPALIQYKPAVNMLT